MIGGHDLNNDKDQISEQDKCLTFYHAILGAMLVVRRTNATIGDYGSFKGSNVLD